MNSDILYFNIRSKECQQLSNNADLVVSLPFSIDIGEDDWLQIEVISAEIPLSFYNISSALENNTLDYGDKTITLKWYNHIKNDQKLLEENSINGKFL